MLVVHGFTVEVFGDAAAAQHPRACVFTGAGVPATARIARTDGIRRLADASEPQRRTVLLLRETIGI